MSPFGSRLGVAAGAALRDDAPWAEEVRGGATGGCWWPLLRSEAVELLWQSGSEAGTGAEDATAALGGIGEGDEAAATPFVLRLPDDRFDEAGEPCTGAQCRRVGEWPEV